MSTILETEPTPKPSAWGTIQQAADYKSVSTKTIRRWIASGDIYAERLGKRIIRVDLNTLDAIGRPLAYLGGDV